MDWLRYHSAVNFLAHVYFAAGDDQAIAGQMLGDFVRGRDLQRFPPAIAAAIQLHRKIDSFTDRHPLTVEARRLFEPPYRRVSGIIIDVVYDHFLAQDWNSYCGQSLPDYAQQVHQAMEKHFDLFPPSLQRFAGYMASANVLTDNINCEHIDLTLKLISRRRSSLQALAESPPVLWQHEAALREIFAGFFPQLADYVATEIAGGEAIAVENRR